MAQSNPYAGTDHESAWQAGYDAGFDEATTEHAPPDDLNYDQRTIFQEGELAGQQDAQGGVRESVPVTPSSSSGGEHGHGENPIAVTGHVVEVTMMAKEGYELQGVLRGTVVVAEGITATGLGVALAIEVLVLLITLKNHHPASKARPSPASSPTNAPPPTAKSCTCRSPSPKTRTSPEIRQTACSAPATGTAASTPDDADGATNEATDYLASHLNLAGTKTLP